MNKTPTTAWFSLDTWEYIKKLRREERRKGKRLVAVRTRRIGGMVEVRIIK